MQGRYRFSDGNIGGSLFGDSNCSDQLAEYRRSRWSSTPAGSSSDESALSPPARVLSRVFAGGGAGGPVGKRHAAPSRGSVAQELRLTPPSRHAGADADSSPGGHVYSTPRRPDRSSRLERQLHRRRARPNATRCSCCLSTRRAAPGACRRRPDRRAPQTLEVAADVPPATVRVKVSHGHGRKWSLAYKVGHYVAGTACASSNAAATARTCSARSSSAAGTFRSSPQGRDLAVRATVVAYLLNAEGATAARADRRRATPRPPPQAGPAPATVRIVRHGSAPLLTWSAARRVSPTFTVKVRGATAAWRRRFPNAHRRSVTIPQALPSRASP